MLVYGLTFDHTTNYGSCFQAFALQRAIEKITVRGEKCSYFLIPIKTFKDYPINRIKNLLISPFMSLHRLQFIPFENKYMNFASCSSLRELPSLNAQADAFVCGSDVIWNPDYNSGLGAFFLDFATKYKFSYAASFGKTEISKNDLDFTREKLASFDAVSVREKTSLEIVCKCTEKPIEMVSDPVLLLETKDWDEITAPCPVSVSKRYIFVYSTHLNKTFKSFIVALRKQTGLEVILSTCGPKQALKQGMLSVQSPQEWLSLLKHAEFIVTNSFHATVFSVMFHKKFYTVVAGDKAKGINMRMNDFLNTVGLGVRIYSSVPEVIDTSEIDFTHTDSVIVRMRSESLVYLQQNLEEAYRRKMQQIKKRT